MLCNKCGNKLNAAETVCTICGQKDLRTSSKTALADSTAFDKWHCYCELCQDMSTNSICPKHGPDFIIMEPVSADNLFEDKIINGIKNRKKQKIPVSQEPPVDSFSDLPQAEKTSGEYNPFQTPDQQEDLNPKDILSSVSGNNRGGLNSPSDDIEDPISVADHLFESPDKWLTIAIVVAVFLFSLGMILILIF